MFVILTYMNEFDKVHYPLSLTKVSGGTDKSHLLGVIDSLKKELAMYKSQGSHNKSLVNPALDISISRSQVPTQTFMGSGLHSDHNNILSPQTDIFKTQPPRYAFQNGEYHTSGLASPSIQVHQQIDPAQNSAAFLEVGQQKVKLLEAKIEALQSQHKVELAKMQEEHAEEMRTILRHAQELEEKMASVEQELEEWRSIAEQRREAGSKDRERGLQREIEGLKRKLNESNANEKLMRAQLKEARETIDVERKKFGVSYKSTSKDKIRPGSPWKKPVSRSGKFF